MPEATLAAGGCCIPVVKSGLENQEDASEGLGKIGFSKKWE